MMRMPSTAKSASAFRTISEVARELDVPQHVLRFWETRFAQLRPLKRGGGRRYYRPEDVDLLRRIQSLLYKEGYTIKGVQRLLKEGRGTPPGDAPEPPDAAGEADFGEDEAADDGTADDGAADDDTAEDEVPPTLSDDVRSELRAVLDELRTMRSLLGAAGDGGEDA